MNLGKLDLILNRDGFVIFICGPKEYGKTDKALFLGEYCYIRDFRREISTNIQTESYMIEKQITSLPDLRDWLQTGGRKLFILDEAGKVIRKMGFMTKLNQEMMDILQLIRHYDAGFVGIAPSETFIDNNFLNTDILDAKIRKLSKTTAKVFDYLNQATYFLYDIPRTSIRFNSKDIAVFSHERQVILSELPLCCQIAYEYASGSSFCKIGKLHDLHPEEVKRMMRKHLKHEPSHLTNKQEDTKSIEVESKAEAI
jgi:hypothetical protein